MKDPNVHEFPIVKQDLTLDEALALVQRRNPQCGILIYECPCGCEEINHVHFGQISRKDALWFAEFLREDALSDD